MSTFPQITHINPPALGAHWPGQGGTYIGTMRGRDGQPDYHLVAAIGAYELEDQEWGSYGKRIDGADSYHDGRANTAAMSAAGLALAQRIQALQIDGHGDFYLPSQAEAHLLAANAKELMQPDVYWTSTQYSAHNAWCQYFRYGHQYHDLKDCEFMAVAVRSIQTVTP